METEESKELTLAQEETIKKTLEEIRKQDPKKNKRVYPIVVFGDEYDDKDVYIAYFREPDFIAFSKFVQLQKKDEIAAVRSLAHDTFIHEIRNWWMMIPCSCMACPQNWSISLVPAKPRSQISRSLASKG